MEFIQEILLDPISLPFMQRAILALVVVGIVSGVMGAYVVTRGMAFLGDALAHSVLPGVAVVFVSGNTSHGGLLIGGLIAGILSAVGIGILTRGRRLTEDTAIGIVFAGTFALGIAIISTTQNYFTDLTHILIGNVLAINSQDLLLIVIVSAVVIVIITALYKEFLLISFDRTLAQTLHLPTELLRMILLILFAVTIVIGVEVVGIALIAAFLVTPAATARLLTKRFHRLMILSAFIASISGIVGMYLAWHFQVAPSAAIVLTMTAIFIIVFLLAPQKGYIWSHTRATASHH